MDAPRHSPRPPPAAAPLRRAVVMLGTDFSAPGGITAVLRAYREVGVFSDWPVRFLPTYRNRFPGDRLFTAAVALLRFLAWLAAGKVAGVHAHTAGRGSFWRKSAFLLLARGAGLPTVLHLHDGTFPAWVDTLGPGRRRAVRWVLEHVTRVWVLTPGWRRTIGALAPGATFRVLPNPVALVPATAPGGAPQSVPFPPPFRVLFLGRLWREKGVFDLVEAVGRAVAADPPLAARLRVTCAGDGDAAPLLARARVLGVAGCLDFPGWVEGPGREALFATANLFVLPSYFEGLPMGVLEAMGRGIPVLATRVGGIPDALGEGAAVSPDGPMASPAGVLIPPGDIPALAASLAALAGDEGWRGRLGAAGRERVRTVYAKDRVLAEMAGLYRELGWLPDARAGASPAGAPSPTVEPS